MNKYTGLSDFEINKRVAEKLGITCEYDMGTVIIYRDSECHAFDPCNNVEQAWEIMMKYNIGVIKNYYDDTWISVSSAGQIEHKNPLVAAMLCFLEL